MPYVPLHMYGSVHSLALPQLIKYVTSVLHFFRDEDAVDCCDYFNANCWKYNLRWSKYDRH